MGMDIYAGTFTRYYARNWKTKAQQFAEANGMVFHRITPNGENLDEGQDSPDVAEIQQAVNAWTNGLLKALQSNNMDAGEAWVDNNEKPYYTDKPDWLSYGALLVFAAYRLLRDEPPKTIEQGMGLEDFEIAKQLEDSEFSNWSLFNVTCWLPFPVQVSFQGHMPNGSEAFISTTERLRIELDQINKIAWNVPIDEQLSWADEEVFTPSIEIRDGKVIRLPIEEQKSFDLEKLARYAFSLFRRAVTFAEKERVPVLLDY